MILFVFPAYAAMGGKLGTSLGIPLGQFSIDRFPNHEFHAVIQTEVANVPGATHLFEEPGILEIVAQEAAQWFTKYLLKR